MSAATSIVPAQPDPHKNTPAPVTTAASSSAAAAAAVESITQQLHQFALTSPEAGATSAPSPQLLAMEKELQALRAQTAAMQASLAKATADAQSLSTAQAAALLEQAVANAAAMQRESNERMESMEKRLVGQLNGLASEQEKVKAVLLYVEAKLASYLPMLDEAAAKRELDKVRSALNARICASPKHDAYHRAFLEVLNATYQAAMVLKTDFVALQSQTGASKAAGVVNKIGTAVGAALSFTPATPLAGMAVGAAKWLVSYFLSRLGERDQRDQLGRLTDAFPSPPVWFDLAERVAATATEAKWNTIAGLEEGGASANKVLQFFKDAADYLKTHSTPPIWQRTAAMDALASLDAIMQGAVKPPVDVDNAVKVLVATALKDAPASKPTPPPSDNSGISKAEVNQARQRAADLQRAAEETERIKAQWKHKLASANDAGPLAPTVVTERVVTIRTWSKRTVGGKKVTVTGDLATLKKDAGAVLGITVAALRDLADDGEIDHISHVEHKAILIATTADEERQHY